MAAVMIGVDPHKGSHTAVAIAALRSDACRQVRPDDHATVLKVWAKRHRDLGRTRTQVVCRLHAVLCELVPGGVAKRITAAHAARVLEQVTPSGAVAQARRDLAADFLDDLRRIDAQMREAKKRLAAAVQASGTTLTEIFGVGPVIAATVTGEAGDTDRFACRDRFAACAGSGPPSSSSWPGRDRPVRLPDPRDRAAQRVPACLACLICHRDLLGKAVPSSALATS